MVVVLAREEEGRALAPEILRQSRRIPRELARELGVTGLCDELRGRLEIVGPGEQSAPQLDVAAEAVGLAKDLLGLALVVPEPRLRRLLVELGDTAFPYLEVKDAPRSIEPARRVRGLPMRPSVPDLELAKQDRPELDEAQGALAPGDDGVHAGTVAVVRTRPAIAITVESSGVAAGPTVAFAGDEIDERGFFGLLHKLPPLARGRYERRWGSLALGRPGPRLGQCRV
jgi:hypothetical protein